VSNKTKEVAKEILQKISTEGGYFDCLLTLPCSASVGLTCDRLIQRLIARSENVLVAVVINQNKGDLFNLISLDTRCCARCFCV